MNEVRIDGSLGEGGGQVLRLAAAFSVIHHVPIHVNNIRAGRSPPGLKKQHVSAMNVLSRVFDAELSGAVEGSSEISFAPGRSVLDHLSIDTGTAASITLVLQAVVPAAALSGTGLTLEIAGGTDVPWSPTFDYFDLVAREAYKEIGIEFEIVSGRRGYYPRGGGRVSASIKRCASIRACNVDGTRAITDVAVVSRCGALPRHVAERQLSSAVSALESAGLRVTNEEALEGESDSPGSSVLAYAVGKGAHLGGDAIGERGKPAEEVGRGAAGRLAQDAMTGASFDANVSDMVIPLLSLATEASKVRVPRLTTHLETGLRLASMFSSCRYKVEASGAVSVVSVLP